MRRAHPLYSFVSSIRAAVRCVASPPRSRLASSVCLFFARRFNSPVCSPRIRRQEACRIMAANLTQDQLIVSTHISIDKPSVCLHCARVTCLRCTQCVNIVNHSLCVYLSKRMQSMKIACNKMQRGRLRNCYSCHICTYGCVNCHCCKQIRNIYHTYTQHTQKNTEKLIFHLSFYIVNSFTLCEYSRLVASFSAERISFN